MADECQIIVQITFRRSQFHAAITQNKALVIIISTAQVCIKLCNSVTTSGITSTAKIIVVAIARAIPLPIHQLIIIIVGDIALGRVQQHIACISKTLSAVVLSHDIATVHHITGAEGLLLTADTLLKKHSITIIINIAYLSINANSIRRCWCRVGQVLLNSVGIKIIAFCNKDAVTNIKAGSIQNSSAAIIIHKINSVVCFPNSTGIELHIAIESDHLTLGHINNCALISIQDNITIKGNEIGLIN